MATWPGTLVGLAPGAQIGTGSKMHARVTGMAAAGAQAIRAGVQWDRIDPDLNGTVDADGFKLVDDLVGACASNDVQLLLTLAGGNNSMNQTAYVTPYVNYCIAVGRHVAGRPGLLGIEIGNEPNHVIWESTGPSASVYANQLKSIYLGLNSPTHTVVVLSAGLGGISDSGGDIPADQFLAQMYSTWGTAGYFDAFNFHPYTYPYTATQDIALKLRGWDLMVNTPNQFGRPSIRTLMDTHGDDEKPIVITEFGVPQYGTTTAQKVVSIMQDGWDVYKNYSWAQEGGGYFWFTYQDKGPPPPPPIVADRQDFHYGIIDVNGVPKTNADPTKDIYGAFQHLESPVVVPPRNNCD